MHKHRLLIVRGIEGSLVLGTIVLALVGFGRILPTLLRVPDSYDFAAYYVAGRTLNSAGNIYDSADMLAAGQRPGDSVAFPRYIYPPFFAVVLRPLASVSFDSAKLLWFIFNLGLLGSAVLLLARMVGMPWWGALGFGISTLLLPPLYDTFLLGQVNIILLWLITLALYLTTRASRGRATDVIAGVLLGIAAVIKVYPLILGGIYLLRRRWSVVGGIAGGIAATLVVGILGAGGAAMTIEYVTTIAPNVGGGVPSITDQSLWPVLSRFFSVHHYRYAYLTPTNLVDLTLYPIVQAPWLGLMLTIIVSMAILGITGWVVVQAHRSGTAPSLWLDLSLGISLIMLLFPVVHDHYLTLLLIPGAYVLQRYQTLAASRWRLRLGLTAVVFWVVLQRYWRVMLAIIPSPVVLVSGLVGAVILWGMLLWLVRADSQPPQADTLAV